MERRSVHAIVDALDRARVRYLVVGGVAVVAHGFLRFTADLDLVLEPDPAALRRAVGALSGLGYRPRAPIEFEAFVHAEQRSEWARDKGMVVFSVFSPEHPATEIDLFLESPFDFESAYARSVRMPLLEGRGVTVVSLEDLLDLKRAAGRPDDLRDVIELEALHESREGEDG